VINCSLYFRAPFSFVLCTTTPIGLLSCLYATYITTASSTNMMNGLAIRFIPPQPLTVPKNKLNIPPSINPDATDIPTGVLTGTYIPSIVAISPAIALTRKTTN